MIANNINNNPNKYRLYVIINADFFKKVMQDHSFHVAVLTVVVNVFQGKEILAYFTLEIYEDTYFYFFPKAAKTTFSICSPHKQIKQIKTAFLN